MAWYTIALATLFLIIGCSRSETVDCDCSYHPGGCVIRQAAPPGFMCRCGYKGGWTCNGVAFPCDNGESCPGNQADYCACKLANGDCGGYVNGDTSCQGSGTPKVGVPREASCDCSYHSGGCSIAKPTPNGWKCVCSYKGFWTCSGWAQQCSHRQHCKGDDYSYCACAQGGGDCGGYPKKPKSCPSNNVPSVCDCKSGSGWNKGLYNIEDVTYDLENNQISSMKPITLTQAYIPNHSEETQTITVEVEERLSKTSEFSWTGGIEIQAGVSFTTGIPIVMEGTVSLSVTTSFSHTFGTSETKETAFANSFTCNGAPHKYTHCMVTVQKAKVSVPYTMQVRHKVIPNCACQSHGVWTSVQAYNAKLISKELGSCPGSSCEHT